MIKNNFLIAEISANHCGSIKKAKRLIKCAKENGADAVKIQTFTPDTMTIKSNNKYFKITEGLWKGYTLWDLYNEAQTPLKWHKELFRYAKQLKIPLFSSPFDETAVDFLEDLKCPFYKIASFEMTDLPLIKKVASTKKTMIISTGTSSLDEIENTYYTAKENGASEVILLYCVSKYPADIRDFNINNIKILKDKFNCKVGLSDHSNDMRIGMMAIAAGAEIIEKHIALQHQKIGLDIDFSLKGNEISKFKDMMNNSFIALGKNEFHRSKKEDKSKKFRRSIFTVANIKKGEKFNKANIRRVRPGNGLNAMYYDQLINKKSPVEIKKNQPMTQEILKKIL